MIKVQIMDWMFSYLSTSLIKWVDPIKKSTFEKQLVIINLLFIIFNHFGMIFLIRLYLPLRFGTCSVMMNEHEKLFEKVILQTGVLSQIEQEYYDWQKINLGCFQEMRNFFGSYIILNFLLSVFRTIYMKVRVSKLKKRNDGIIEKLKDAAQKKFQIFQNKQQVKTALAKVFTKTFGSSKAYPTNAIPNDDEPTKTSNDELPPNEPKGEKMNELKKTITQLSIAFKKNKKPTESDMMVSVPTSKKNEPEEQKVKAYQQDMFRHYYLINQFIEQEIYLENSNQSDDVDSTIRHFNQIFVMFTALCLFGMLFPMSFFLYYFAIILEVYNDRQEFLFISRRPTPKEMNSIGYFKLFLDVCPKLSLITTAYFLSFNMYRITLNINYVYLMFVTIFFFGNVILQVVYAINPKGTGKMKDLVERQGYLSRLVNF